MRWCDSTDLSNLHLPLCFTFAPPLEQHAVSKPPTTAPPSPPKTSPTMRRARRAASPLVLALSLVLAARARAAPGYDCPLIDGARACVAVLGACETCVPDRGPTDAVCAESLVCDAEDAECRGVGANEFCGKENGKECDDGLVCRTIIANPLNGMQRAVCFVEGGEGDVCDAPRRESKAGDVRFRSVCGEGLLCYDGKDGRGKLCCKDDGREETCQFAGCSRKGQECRNRVCVDVLAIGETCEPGRSRCGAANYRAGACADSALFFPSSEGGFKCVTPKSVGEFCDTSVGRTEVCRTRAMLEGTDVRDVVDLRCEGNVCAEDEGSSGLFQFCSDDSDCSPSGLVCAEAQDKRLRCLNLFTGAPTRDRTYCASSDIWARAFGMPSYTCRTGYRCGTNASDTERRESESCQVDPPPAPANAGESCGFGSPNCAAADSAGRSVYCQRVPFSNDAFCRSVLEDGESCGIENSICGPTDTGGPDCQECDELRSAKCDESNVCRVTKDETCKVDSDCDSSPGTTCVSVNVLSPGRKTCYNYNRQIGESCSSGSYFGSPIAERCAPGLICYVKVGEGGRGNTRGTCTRLVADGERCSEDESIECLGRRYQPFISICINGTCRPL